MPKEDKSKGKDAGFKFGPFEQALAVMLIMGLAGNPSIPYFMANMGGLTPPLIMLILIAYVEYHFLRRQEHARNRAKALASKVFSNSSSSSSTSSSTALSSKDIRFGGLPVSSKSGNPAPKQVSGKSLDPRKDPSSSSFRKNYFLAMQGPGRPALVPFQDGLRPGKGEAESTLWWDNVPDDAKDLMAAPLDADKLKAMMKNPWNLEMMEKDVELLKMTMRHKEEQERYEKVGNILHTLFSMLLCVVDMRLGIASFIFFLWKHFTAAHQQDMSETKDEIEKEKADLLKQISEAKKAAADSSQSQQLSMLQQKLMRLGG